MKKDRIAGTRVQEKSRWRRVTFGIIFLGAFACFASLAFAQNAPLTWERAGELIKAGRYAEALEETERLLAEKPDEVITLRLKGICLLQLGDADGAVQVLQKALQIDPESIASRYYLAQAFAYRGSISIAIQLLQEVRQKAADSLYAEQAAQALVALENLAVTGQAISDRRRWNVSLRESGEYDDNVLGRSRHDDTDPSDSFRFASAAYLELRPIDQQIDRLPFTLGTAYTLYQSVHERDSFEDFDLTSQMARVFLSRGGKLKIPYQFRVTNDYTHNQLGFKLYSREIGLGMDLDLQWASWAVLSPGYSIRWKDFNGDSDFPGLFSRDGHDQSLSVRQRFYTFKNRVIFDLSYAFRWTSTRGSQFDKQHSNDAGGSVNVALPWKFRLATGVKYQNEDAIKFSPQPDRVDNIWNVYTTLSRPLWPKGVVIETSFNHTSGDSTQDFSDYRRNVYGITLSYYY